MRLRTRVFFSLLFFFFLALPAFARNYRVSDFQSTITVDNKGAVFDCIHDNPLAVVHCPLELVKEVIG